MNEQARQELLQQLRGLHAPDVSRWPAPGWWLVALLLAIMAIVLIYIRRRHRASLWQREARNELSRIRSAFPACPTAETLADTSKLARRVLIVSMGREKVAQLHGESWLKALDSVCQRPLFASGHGRLLESAPYQRAPQVSDHDLQSLLDAMEVLIAAAPMYKAEVSA